MQFKQTVLNKVFISGTLVNDPRKNVTNSNVSVVNFRIVAVKKYKTLQGVPKEKACFVNIVTWGKLADLCANNLEKGDVVFVEGELQSNQITINPEDERKFTIVEILGNHVQFLTRKEYFRNVDRVEDNDSELENSSEEQDSDNSV